MLTPDDRQAIEIRLLQISKDLRLPLPHSERVKLEREAQHLEAKLYAS